MTNDGMGARRMSESDDALLRQILVGQGELKGEIMEMKTLVSERRRHADNLDVRVESMENRVRSLELQDAEAKGIPDSVTDHESRIRSLESMRWQLLAVSFLGSGIGAAIAWIVGSGIVVGK